jgi:hypothetical protein
MHRAARPASFSFAVELVRDEQCIRIYLEYVAQRRSALIE